MYSQEHCETDNSPGPIVPIPVQPTPPEAVNKFQKDMEDFKRYWSSKVESIFENEPVEEMIYENVGLGVG